MANNDFWMLFHFSFVLMSMVLVGLSFYYLSKKRYQAFFGHFVSGLVIGGCLVFIHWWIHSSDILNSNRIKNQKDIVKIPNCLPSNYRCYGSDCVAYFLYLDPFTNREKEITVFTDSKDARRYLNHISYSYGESFNLYVKRESGKMNLELVESVGVENYQWYDFIWRDGVILRFDKK